MVYLEKQERNKRGKYFHEVDSAITFAPLVTQLIEPLALLTSLSKFRDHVVVLLSLGLSSADSCT